MTARSCLAWLAMFALACPVSAQTSQWILELDPRVPESPNGSYYRPNNSAVRFYLPAQLVLELPGTGGQIQSGQARLLDFRVPQAAVDNIGMYFAHTNVPSVVTGTITVDTGTNTAELDFPPFQVDFVRGNNQQSAHPGSLMLGLSTSTPDIPGNCDAAGPFPGAPLNLSTGELRLTGWVCPYSTTTASWEEAYRLQVRGMLPEPRAPSGTLAGILVLGLLARRRRREAP